MRSSIELPAPRGCRQSAPGSKRHQRRKSSSPTGLEGGTKTSEPGWIISGGIPGYARGSGGRSASVT